MSKAKSKLQSKSSITQHYTKFGYKHKSLAKINTWHLENKFEIRKYYLVFDEYLLMNTFQVKHKVLASKKICFCL